MLVYQSLSKHHAESTSHPVGWGPGDGFPSTSPSAKSAENVVVLAMVSKHAPTATAFTCPSSSADPHGEMCNRKYHLV